MSNLHRICQDLRHAWATWSKRIPFLNNCNKYEYDEFPITARYQRRRQISEGKRDNFVNTIILETQLPETQEPIVPQVVKDVNDTNKSDNKDDVPIFARKRL
jgi:hypothetical protein